MDKYFLLFFLFSLTGGAFGRNASYGSICVPCGLFCSPCFAAEETISCIAGRCLCNDETKSFYEPETNRCVLKMRDSGAHDCHRFKPIDSSLPYFPCPQSSICKEHDDQTKSCECLPHHHITQNFGCSTGLGELEASCNTDSLYNIDHCKPEIGMACLSGTCGCKEFYKAEGGKCVGIKGTVGGACPIEADEPCLDEKSTCVLVEGKPQCECLDEHRQEGNSCVYFNNGNLNSQHIMGIFITITMIALLI